MASPRSLRKTCTYSREDLLGSAHKKNSGSDSFTFDLPSPTTPSTSLGTSGIKDAKVTCIVKVLG